MNRCTNGAGLSARRAHRLSRRMKSRLRVMILSALGVCAVGAGSFLAGLHTGGEASRVSADGSGGCTTEISVACEGWSDCNVGLGVFLSGFATDGTKIEDHLLFEEPGALAVDLDAVYYELVPQLPQIMTSDGVVRAAGDAVVVDAHGKQAASAPTILYEPVETSEMPDEELLAIAEASFDDPSIAAAAVARAQASRNLNPMQQGKCVDDDNHLRG